MSPLMSRYQVEDIEMGGYVDIQNIHSEYELSFFGVIGKSYKREVSNLNKLLLIKEWVTIFQRK